MKAYAIANVWESARYAPDGGSGANTLVTPSSTSGTSPGKINLLGLDFTAGDAIGAIQSGVEIAIDRGLQAAGQALEGAASLAVQSVGIGLSAATTYIEALGDGLSVGAAAFKTSLTVTGNVLGAALLAPLGPEMAAGGS